MNSPLLIAAAFTVVAISTPVLAGPAEDIVAKEKCSKCHTATTTKKAPSWASIAEKNKGKPAAHAQMIETLKTGGKDDHPKVAASDADLKAVVDLVMQAK
ncbi:MAG: c-type cytochrome [Burkholderiaceae bacterium]